MDTYVGLDVSLRETSVCVVDEAGNVVALTTTMAVPVVGALLIFSLLISPAAAARSFTNKPLTAISLSVLICSCLRFVSPFDVATGRTTPLSLPNLSRKPTGLVLEASRCRIWR